MLCASICFSTLGPAVSAGAQSVVPPGVPTTAPQDSKLRDAQAYTQADGQIMIPGAEDEGEEADAAKLSGAVYDEQVTVAKVLVLNGGVAAEKFAVPAAADLAKKLEGTSIKVRRLFEVKFQMQALYRSRGHFLARVILERQKFDPKSATVTYKIYEGTISAVAVNGEVGPVKSLIQRMANRLVTDQPVTLAEVERQLLLIQDIPGISVRARFAAAPSQEGATVLTIDVARTPYAGFASIDNRGAGFAGPWQGALGLSANSFTGLGERTGVYLFSTPDREQRFGQLAFSTVLTADGLALRAQGGYGPSYPGGLLGEAGFASNVTTAGLELGMPMLRSRRSNLWLHLGFSLNNSHIRLKQADDRYQRITSSHVRVASLGLQANHVDQWDGVTDLSLDVDQGMEGLGATSRDDPMTARPDSRPDFTRFTGRLSRRQALPAPGGPGPWELDLRLTLAGQYGVGVLPPSQKAQLGGLEFGRGYYYGLLTGDRALSGSVELTARRPIGGWIADARIAPYIFYDHGMVWNVAEGDPGRRFLHSAGGGLRLDLGPHVSTEVEYARRLVTNPSRTNETALAPSRVFGRLIVRY
ncbi:ShlB/FhaC/HecB family hemolysin secretion/activation protein [Niveispirillum sp. KHB5.9]|uniref:ShlB/FhaC/HecB family hemolysin secretion/activation protein n=1 Tax=Niveispirillum sp. KHB5.9 TaxID=3400269 RepID=UPI003A88C16C